MTADDRDLATWCLRPYDGREALTVHQAVAIAGRSAGTIRNWVAARGIGRRIVGGKIAVSRIAMAMLLDDDHKALADYLEGKRDVPAVIQYYERLGLADVLVVASASKPRPPPLPRSAPIRPGAFSTTRLRAGG
jgi:hypothetical protein